MRFVSRSLSVVTLGLMFGVPTAGCASVNEGTGESSSELSAVLHEPQGAERKAIFEAFRAQLSIDLHGQQVIFNANDPVGRYKAHGDWAYFEGILEGPEGNTRPIDYQNSIFKDDAANGFLGGVQRNGHFAAKFQSLAHRENDGTWRLGKVKFGTSESPTYTVGPKFASWESWVSVPPPGFRDVFAAFPIDDLHEPQAEERSAILATLGAQLSQDLHGQVPAFNAAEPAGTFLSHDGWAFFSGIIEGPNGNAQPIDYRNSIYSQTSQGTAFKGVLKNNNFAATIRAILKKDADGTWHLSPTKTQDFSSPGYAVGATTWVGDPGSQFAWDILGNNGNGNGNGNGDGDGDGDGDGG
jgi:hypothetical protein